MSGKATGWALKNYPVETPADRNRKLILVGVADAANQYGERARPGLKVLCDEWGFDKSTVIRHLHELVQTGWLEVTERGRGRGNSSEYCLPQMVAERHLFEQQNATFSGPKRWESQPGKVAISAAPLSLDGSENGNANGAEPASPPPWVEEQITYREWLERGRATG